MSSAARTVPGGGAGVGEPDDDEEAWGCDVPTEGMIVGRAGGPSDGLTVGPPVTGRVGAVPNRVAAHPSAGMPRTVAATTATSAGVRRADGDMSDLAHVGRP